MKPDAVRLCRPCLSAIMGPAFARRASSPAAHDMTPPPPPTHTQNNTCASHHHQPPPPHPPHPPQHYRHPFCFTFSCPAQGKKKGKSDRAPPPPYKALPDGAYPEAVLATAVPLDDLEKNASYQGHDPTKAHGVGEHKSGHEKDVPAEAVVVGATTSRSAAAMAGAGAAAAAAVGAGAAAVAAAASAARSRHHGGTASQPLPQVGRLEMRGDHCFFFLLAVASSWLEFLALMNRAA